MMHPLSAQQDFSLRHHNTFGVAAKARAFLPVNSVEILLEVKRDAALSSMPRLVLGGGSNILFAGDYPGLVLHMCIKGIEIESSDVANTYVRAAGGENWHDFVLWTLNHGLGGLENLSLIPGSVGAAPIQNIGAYGVEIDSRVHSLRYFDFDSGEIVAMEGAACEFSYRDSVFKHRLRDSAAILDVTFALPRKWQPELRYAELAQELAARGVAAPSALDISDAVIAIRSRKLPDPAVIGNAGSFFKNPIVSATQRDALLASNPKLVSYPQPDGRCKLAAGWLIDQCGWKGKTVGPAGVYEKQALVLVNHGGASGQDIVHLADLIRAAVAARFGVSLEMEPVMVPVG